MIDVLLHIQEKLEKSPDDISLYEDFSDLAFNLRDEYPSETLKGLRWLLSALSDASGRSTDIDFIKRARDVYFKTLYSIAYDDLDAYLQYTEWDKPPEKKIYLPRRHVLKPRLVDHLQDLEDGVIDFLGVSMPPRTGKSVTCKMAMSWHMGRHPDTANAMAGYSGSLAQGFYDDVLEFITGSDYKFADVFPDAPFASKSAEYLAIDLGKKKTYHSLTCRGIGGSWTGGIEIGEDGWLYCDDLIEDEEEANSLQRLEKKYQAYVNHLRDRKKEGARELMVGTRWNVFDPLGRLYEEFGEDERYRFVVSPALDDNGESNFVYYYNLGFSTEYYKDVKRVTDDADWEAKYMGKPYVREGILYDSDALRRFFELPEGEPDAIISVCDTKSRGDDYAVLPVVYVYGQDYYVKDVICDNGLPEVIDQRVENMLMDHKVQLCRFESNVAGGRIARDIDESIRKRGGACHITTKYTTSNKETRIMASSGWVKEHCLFLDHSMGYTEDYSRFMRFLTTYSMSGKNKHDDAPDAMSLLCEFARQTLGSSVEVIDRLW